MIIKVDQTHYKRIINAINSGAKIDYITSSQVKEDYENHFLYMLKDNAKDKIMAIFSIVYDTERNFWYFKRLKILNQKNKGKGIANRIIEWVSQLPIKVAVTPWEDNQVMCRLLEKYGFVLRYMFNNNWCYYTNE